MSIWQSIRIATGMTLLPVITPLIDKSVVGGQTPCALVYVISQYSGGSPYHDGDTRFYAAGAAANIVMGISKFIMAGLVSIWGYLVAC
ncbi:hypothetical protein AB6F62_16640 [Providencia huaxiensis]|uniref:hypothetical protein n=1 Tax=Providencia huaxiensis TaxID=2027290 RepID=UPI0034DD6ED9